MLILFENLFRFWLEECWRRTRWNSTVRWMLDRGGSSRLFDIISAWVIMRRLCVMLSSLDHFWWLIHWFMIIIVIRVILFLRTGCIMFAIVLADVTEAFELFFGVVANNSATGFKVFRRLSWDVLRRVLNVNFALISEWSWTIRLL